MTQQIATAVETHLRGARRRRDRQRPPSLMGCRGVKLRVTQLVTPVMPGTLRNSTGTRSEFLRLRGT